jgi:hypothetical protein
MGREIVYCARSIVFLLSKKKLRTKAWGVLKKSGKAQENIF